MNDQISNDEPPRFQFFRHSALFRHYGLVIRNYPLHGICRSRSEAHTSKSEIESTNGRESDQSFVKSKMIEPHTPAAL